MLAVMLCVVGMDTYILLFSSQGRVHFGPCCARIVDWVLVQIVVLRVTVPVVRTANVSQNSPRVDLFGLCDEDCSLNMLIGHA